MELDWQVKFNLNRFLMLYSDFSKLGCLWELIIGEACCIVFDLKRYWKY